MSGNRLAKGLISGLAAGLAATWLKDRFQTNLSAAISTFEPPKKLEGEQDAPSTLKTAEAISEGLFGHKLTKREAKFASPAVDYAFGTLAGGAYGLAAELLPEVTSGFGLGLGAGLWLFADEIGLPALGLAKWARDYPASVHGYGLSGHLVYGLAAELARRIVRRELR